MQLSIITIVCVCGQFSAVFSQSRLGYVEKNNCHIILLCIKLFADHLDLMKFHGKQFLKLSKMVIRTFHFLINLEKQERIWTHEPLIECACIRCMIARVAMWFHGVFVHMCADVWVERPRDSMSVFMCVCAYVFTCAV